MVAAVLGHVGQEGLVEGGEVLIVHRPEVGEGVVILVKHGVVGVEHVVVTRVALPVHPHPEGGVGQDVVGHTPDKAGGRILGRCSGTWPGTWSRPAGR